MVSILRNISGRKPSLLAQPLRKVATSCICSDALIREPRTADVQEVEDQLRSALLQIHKSSAHLPTRHGCTFALHVEAHEEEDEGRDRRYDASQVCVTTFCISFGVLPLDMLLFFVSWLGQRMTSCLFHVECRSAEKATGLVENRSTIHDIRYGLDGTRACFHPCSLDNTLHKVLPD